MVYSFWDCWSLHDVCDYKRAQKEPDMSHMRSLIASVFRLVLLRYWEDGCAGPRSIHVFIGGERSVQ